MRLNFIAVAILPLCTLGSLQAQQTASVRTQLLITVDAAKRPDLKNLASDLRTAVPASSVVLSQDSEYLHILTPDLKATLNLLRESQLLGQKFNISEVVSARLGPSVERTVPHRAIRDLFEETNRGKPVPDNLVSPRCEKILEKIGSRVAFDPGIQQDSNLPTPAEFDKACFATLFPPDLPDRLPNWLDQNDPSQAIGALTIAAADDPQGPFCIALLLSPRVILTARHCFFTGDGQRILSHARLRAGQVAFTRASSPYKRVRVLAESPFTPAEETDFSLRPVSPQTERKFNLPEDFIVLRLEEDVGPVPSLHIATSTANRRAFLAGPLNVVSVDPSATVPAAVRGLRWDTNASCRTLAQANTCARHTCQALKGFSGSPLFVERQVGEPKGLVFAGLHVAPANNGSGCEALLRNSISQEGNISIMPPKLSVMYAALNIEEEEQP